MQLDMDIFVGTWMDIDTERLQNHKAISNFAPGFSTYPADAIAAAHGTKHSASKHDALRETDHRQERWSNLIDGLRMDVKPGDTDSLQHLLYTTEAVCLHPFFCDVVDAIDEHLRHGNTTLHEFRVLREIAGISRLSGFLELSGKESSELQNIEKEFPIVLLLRCLQVHRLLYQFIYCGGSSYEDLKRYLTVDSLEPKSKYVLYRKNERHTVLPVWWSGQSLSVDTVRAAVEVVQRFVLAVAEWNIATLLVSRYDTGGYQRCGVLVDEILRNTRDIEILCAGFPDEMLVLEEIKKQATLKRNLLLFERLQAIVPKQYQDNMQILTLSILNEMLNAALVLNKHIGLLQCGTLSSCVE